MTMTLSILASIALGFSLGFYVGLYRPSHEKPEVPSIEGADDDL